MRRARSFVLAGAVVAALFSGGAAHANHVPDDKSGCKDGGYTAFDYKNQGQCIKAFNEANKSNNGKGKGSGNDDGGGTAAS